MPGSTEPIELLSADAYHSDPALSAGQLIEFTDRRTLYYLRHVARTIPQREATKEMDLGTVVHAALLEPHKSVCVPYPPGVLGAGERRGTKACEVFEAQCDYSGLIPLKTAELNAAFCMVASVKTAIGNVLGMPTGIRERPFFWTDDETDLACRCKPDFLALTARVMVDLKTTKRVTPSEFERYADQSKHWLRAAHYLSGAETQYGIGDWRYLFVAVESVPPHETVVYEYSPQNLADAELYRADAMRALVKCRETGDWRDEWTGAYQVMSKKLWSMK